MHWSIAELARDSGVSSRTLRHYDAIGLLPPAWTHPSGRRFYQREQLLRLQRILVLRELGLSLETIGRVLAMSRDADAVGVLTQHRDWLVAERERLERLTRTVESTIENLREGGEMTPKQVFEGFEHNPYEAEARERWGDAAIDESQRRLRNLTPEQAELARTGHTRVYQGLAPLRAAGVAVTDERVQALVALHHQVVSLAWTPDATAYRCLAQMYVDDERFHEAVGGGDPELVTYLRDAIHVYADTRL
jgi:DNA-binding transcriptional MerR regulator